MLFNVCCKWVLFERVILSVSLVKGIQGYVTCKRLGWDTLLCRLCVCLPLPRTLHCSVLWTLNVFYLSCMCSALAGELCFWCHKCQTLMELNSTRSYHASARHCKWLQKGDLIWETTGACLLACTLVWQPSKKNVLQVKWVNTVSYRCVIVKCRVMAGDKTRKPTIGVFPGGHPSKY